MYTIRVQASFSAAHHIHGADNRCENVHGHNYRVEVEVGAARLKKPGMVADFVQVRGRLQGILPDHRLLNDVYDFNPTAENLARRFFDELSAFYAVTRVTVWETEMTCATFSAG